MNAPAPATASAVPSRLKALAPAALIVCATIVAYLPALSGGFIWNDSDYVTAPLLRSWMGLLRIWTQPGATQQYYPLLHSFFWLEHLVFGDTPYPYHLTTVLLHAGCAVLFAEVLKRLIGGPEGAAISWLAGLLFALHPVHAESVAWVTEEKNTLSLAFYLAAVAMYLRFDASRQPRAYAIALALFAASMGCKTVTATLPAALLVILWWKRGRLDWRRDVLPLLPWLAFGAAAGVFSSWVEKVYVGAQGLDFTLPFAGRLLVAGRAVAFYLGDLVWPFGLNFVYPRWTVDPGTWWQWLFPIAVCALGAGLWALRRRSRAPLAAFLFFVGSLFPVLGFVNLYGARYSWVWDHWQYLPDLGPIALGAAALIALRRRASRVQPWIANAILAAIAVLYGALTWAQCGIFHDDPTLYRATLARNPGSWFAHNNLGNIWLETPGRIDDAIREFNEALRLEPDFAGAHNNLGLAWSKLPGRLDDAVAQFKEALRLQPDYAGAHNNLGYVWSADPGKQRDALSQFNEALRLEPNLAEAHYNLGNLLSGMPGRTNEAIAEFEAALRLQPESAQMHNNLGLVLAQTPGRLSEAIVHYREAIRINPGFAGAHNNLGIAWAQIPGRMNDAVFEFRQALRLQPNYVEAGKNLAMALSLQRGGAP